MSSRQLLEWQVWYRLRHERTGPGQPSSGKSPQQQLDYVQWLNTLFGGKDLRKKTG